MFTKEGKRKLFRIFSYSDLPRCILYVILLAFFINLVYHLVDLIDNLEARISASSLARRVKP